LLVLTATCPLGSFPGGSGAPGPPPPYARGVLSELRGPDGGPRLRVRLLALLVVLGLVALTAPLVVVPLVERLLTALF
jgi:hypothetical protein